MLSACFFVVICGLYKLFCYIARTVYDIKCVAALGDTKYCLRIVAVGVVLNLSFLKPKLEGEIDFKQQWCHKYQYFRDNIKQRNWSKFFTLYRKWYVKNQVSYSLRCSFSRSY